MKEINLNINTAYLLNDNNEKLIKQPLQKIDQVIEISPKNPLDESEVKSAQSNYTTSEGKRPRKIYYISDLNDSHPDSLIKLLAESRPLNLTFIINLSGLDSQPQKTKDAIMANTSQFYVDLSLPKQKVDPILNRVKSASFEIPSDRKEGMIYHKSIHTQDGQINEQIISKP